MLEPKWPLKVFLCHASQDKPVVRELAQRLFAEGWIDPWLDEKKLLPGQDWRLKIEEAVETSDIVIICLSSNSVSKEGFVQKELRYAKEIALEKPDETIFLIPLRLDDCETPRGLRFYQWGDYFGEKKDETYTVLLQSLELRYQQKLMLEEKALARQEKERLEREATEKAVREKEEHERVEKLAQEELERETAEKARREKLEREAAAKAAQEKAKRDATEKARHERVERLKKNFLQAMPFLRIGGVVGIILVLFLVGLWAIPNFMSLFPTVQAIATLPTSATTISVDTPVLRTEVPVSIATLTETVTPTPVPTLVFKQLEIAGAPITLVPISDESAEAIEPLHSYNIGDNLIRWDISPDGAYFITGHTKFENATKYVVKVWDVLNGNELDSYKLPYPTILNDIYALDNKVYITTCNKSSSYYANADSYSCKSGELLVFDAPQVSQIKSQAKYPGKILGLSHNGDMAIVRTCMEGPGYICVQCNLRPGIVPCAFHQAQLWDMQEKLLKEYDRYDSIYQPAVFSPDDSLFALDIYDKASPLDSALLIHSKAIIEPVKTLDLVDYAEEADAEVYDFSPDGTTLAVGMSNAVIQVWRLDSDEILHLLSGHTGNVISLSYSAHGKYLLSSSANEIILWDLLRGESLKVIDVKDMNFVSFAFDDMLIISVSRDGSSVSLWGVEQ